MSLVSLNLYGISHLYRYTNHMLTYTQPHMQMRTRQTNILSHAHRFVPLLLIDSLDSDCFNSENAARMAIYSQRTLEKFRLRLEIEPIECLFSSKSACHFRPTDFVSVVSEMLQEGAATISTHQHIQWLPRSRTGFDESAVS